MELDFSFDEHALYNRNICWRFWTCWICSVQNFDLGNQDTSNAKRVKVLVVVSAQEKKRSGNTEGQTSDMIGAGDNSNIHCENFSKVLNSVRGLL